MSTFKQQKARLRNHLKMRLTGLYFTHDNGEPNNFDDAPVTKEEGELLYQMNVLRLKLLDHWDENNIKLGFSPKRVKKET